MRFVVSGKSMLPAYPAGSKLFVSRIVHTFYKPRIGDTVVLRDPRDGRLILKRIKSKSNREYLVEGDNPPESTDSRHFGPVKKEDIIGKVMFRYSKNKEEWLIILIIVFAIVGLADSLYLTYAHYQQSGAVVCDVGACNVVTTSQYSVIMGVPLALLGVFFYLSLLTIVLLYKKRGGPKVLRALNRWVALGFMMSIYLTYLQAFIIHAYCPLCLTSAGFSTLIFLSVLALNKENNNRKVAGV